MFTSFSKNTFYTKHTKIFVPIKIQLHSAKKRWIMYFEWIRMLSRVQTYDGKTSAVESPI